MIKKFTDKVLKQEGKILVKFGSTWCTPCKAVVPALEKLSEEGYKIYEVDSDEDQDSTIKYGIRAVPTFHIFENGNIINTVTGIHTFEQFEDLLM